MKINLMRWALLVTIALAIAACTENKGAEKKGPPPIPVSVVAVEETRASYYNLYPGDVVSLNQVELRPEVAGYITGIYFKDGQHVRQGMKLYAIDQRLYQAAYDQASANVNVAKANLSKAQGDANRYRDLAKNDAVARQILEHALADLKSAKMQVAAAEASLKSASTNLHYSIVTAPFDGTIGISSVKLGSTVAAGQTLLNTLSSDNPMAVDCAVDEKEIPRFTELLNNAGNASDSTFTIVLPDQNVYPYNGRLSVMDRSVDPQTGTIRIRTTFPNPHNILRAGLTCVLRVLTVTPPKTVLIPAEAVVEQMGEYFVFAVQNGAAIQKRVKLGRTLNARVIVTEGLTAGEQIVTEGIQKLRDHAPVVFAPENAASANRAQAGH